MKKRMVALACVFVMLSTVVVTSAVSTAQAGQSNIRHYEVLSWMAHDKVVGKLTVDVKTGHYVVTVNYGKGGLKDAAKQASKSGIIKAQNTAAQPWEITFGSVTMTNGGTAREEGTLTNAINHPDVKVVNWLDTHGGDAKIYLNFPD